MSIIEINNITKRYNDKLAVDNLSLSIETGEIYGLLGPNGAGKSTAISIICGLIKPDSGDVSVEGHLLSREALEAKKNIGLVPQEIALYEAVSALDNLEFWGTMYGLHGKLLKSRIDEALETTGLKERAREKVSTYSGGMKRRINIACSIMHHPKILIMDEPTVGIDPQSRNHIMEFTKNMNRELGTTVIYTSHYMEEVQDLCHKIAILDNGKLIANGTLNDITRMVVNDDTLEVCVSDYDVKMNLLIKHISDVKQVDFHEGKIIIIIHDAHKSLQKIIEILYNAGAKIQDMSIKKPSLETVFLSLTGKNLRD